MKHPASSIKRKLQISFLSLVLLSALSGILSYQTLTTIVAQESLKSKVDRIVSAFAEMRKEEKDFLLFTRKEEAFLKNGESKSLHRHAAALTEIKEAMAGIHQHKSVAIQGELNSLAAVLQAYEESFLQLVRSYKIRGFKDYGLEGDMREIVHQLQQCESKEEQWFALMLRRHEKDFFIRLDEKYIRTLHERAAEFKAFVKASEMPHMSQEYKVKALEAIDDYKNHFNKIARIEKEIGLTPQQGLLGVISDQTGQAELILTKIQQEIYAKTSKLTDTSLVITLVSVLLMVFGGIGFALVLARVISAPIIKLSYIVKEAVLGDRNTLEALQSMKRGEDELGKLIRSFGNMFLEMNLKVLEISEKNADLELAAQKEKERSWLTEGLSMLENVLSQHSGDLQLLCDQFLFHLVKYSGAHQAVLFSREGKQQEESYMKLRSCYAMHKRRYHQLEVVMGEGLVGTVWQEKEPIYMNDIPEQYSKIRSGLGESKPTSILVVPALFEGTVEGVVEIGALKEFTENEKRLVKEACKAFAGAVSRVRMQEQTQLLLQEANRLTEELQARLEIHHA